MIRLQRITTADTDLYSYMEKLMTQSFPSEEYRELEELRKYTDTKTHFYNNIIFHNNTPVGLITHRDLDAAGQRRLSVQLSCTDVFSRARYV